ncbi:MAG: leucyl aminopeptidase family protein [Phycisphaerales bacterium]|nr:leucyl aminopeptidase family protein [Phycisphaerales bacterium]
MYKSIAAGSGGSGSSLRVHLVSEQTRRLPDSIRAHAGASEALKRPDFKREPGELVVVDKKLALVGIGPRNGLDTERFRKIGAKLVKALDRLGARKVLLDLESLTERQASETSFGRALSEGAVTANWRMDLFDGAASKQPQPRGKLTLTSTNKNFTNGLRTGITLGDGMNFARKLAATPPNVCTPTYVAQVARSVARQHEDLTCSVITYQQARRLGMGGLENVGKGSASKPCMVVLEWKPAKTVTKERLALVGKTITYDTGGYSLKTGGGMRGMKYDKNGGMAVLGAMKAIAESKLPMRVVALLPAAENMVSSESYRPDDIITMYNGITVEVTNTDAEGRLVLADALSYACRKYKPSAIVDMATLTGGVVVALGSFCSGYWCEDSTLRGRLERAATSSDERIWRLPLWQDHRDFMRSQHADILNSNPRREAHPIQGAAFLSYFVDENVPWAHVDIAGTSSRESGNDMMPPGPTGWGVRLLYDLAGSYVS